MAKKGNEMKDLNSKRTTTHALLIMFALKMKGTQFVKLKELFFFYIKTLKLQKKNPEIRIYNYVSILPAKTV